MKKTSIALSAVSLSVMSTLNAYAAEADNAVSAKKEFKGDRIVVSATRAEQPLSDVPASVSVVNDKQIEQFVLSNLSDLFKYDPSITSTGNAGQAQTLSVRGIGGNRLVYIQDGRRINDSYAGGGGFIVGRGYLESDNIKQIEVAKGAASSLYGSDALAGIVVIQTKTPNDLLDGSSSFAQIQTGYKSDNHEAKLSFHGARQFNDWATSVAITSRHGKETQNYSSTLPGFNSDSLSILLKAQTAMTKTDSLMVSLDLYEQETTQQLQLDDAELGNGDSTNDTNKNNALSIAYESTNATTAFDAWSGQIYISDYEQLSDQIRHSAAYVDINDYQFSQNIVGLRAQFTKLLSSNTLQHDITYGFDYDQYDTERPRFKTQMDLAGNVIFSNEPQKAFPGADTSMTGIYIQNAIDTGSALSFIAALRFDDYRMSAKDSELYDNELMADINEQAWSPKIAAAFQLNDVTKLYAQYMRGFKIPPHDQAYQNHGVEPFYQILPNPELTAETSDTIEVGIKGQTENVRFSVAYFDSKFDDFIETQLVATEPTYIPGVSKAIYQHVNLAEATVQGWELNGQYWFNDEMNVEVNLADTRGTNQETGQPLQSISPLTGSLIFATSVTDWQHSIAMRFAQAQDDVPSLTSRTGEIEPAASSEGYAVIDLYTQLSLGDWRVSGGVNNLLDKEYYVYQSVAGLAQDSAKDQYTQPGRSLSINVNYQF